MTQRTELNGQHEPVLAMPKSADQDPPATESTFDLSRLRIKQPLRNVIVRPTDLKVVTRTSRHEYFRTFPGEAYQQEFAGVHLESGEMEKEFFLVAGDMVDHVVAAGGIVALYRLFFLATQGNRLLVLPARLPDAAGSTAGKKRSGEQWATSRLSVLKEGEKHWVAMQSKSETGNKLAQYVAAIADDQDEKPCWPEPMWTPDEVLVRAFVKEDLIIDRPDHPAIKAMRGKRV